MREGEGRGGRGGRGEGRAGGGLDEGRLVGDPPDEAL